MAMNAANPGDAGPAKAPPGEPSSARPSSARPSSAWVFGLWCGGLALVFLGERVLAPTPAAHWTATGLGVAAMMAAVVRRWVVVSRLLGDARGIERAFAWLSTAALLALVLYFATTDPFAERLGLSRMALPTRKRAESLLTCAWVFLILLSLVPMIFAQLALEPMRRAERVEWRRVRSALASGAAIAMACGYATLFTFAAQGLALRADFSHLRTARPSEATVKLAQSVLEPVRVIAFFPPVSEVRVEVLRYLDDLARQSPTVHVESVDRLAAPALAKEMSVTQDGTVLLVRGAARESLTFPPALVDARAKLKSLDADVYKAFLKVLRAPRNAYLTIGHGELNDTHERDSGRSALGVREVLERLNFSVRTVGVTDGLAVDVPKDATVLIALGPTEAFSPQELSAIDRYLKAGGHALFALDPEGARGADALAPLVGLTLKTDILCDDRNHAARRMNDSDNAIILTNRFSSHPSVATLSRLGSRALFFLNAGSLEVQAGGGVAPDFIVRSLPSTFADKNKNFRFDAPDEARASLNLAAAVSRKIADAPPTKGASSESAAGPPEMRAVVVADGDVFSDAALMNASLANGNPQFLADIAKWLGGDEATVGALPDTGQDVRIEHGKQKDTALFYGTIFGAPAMVMGFGLFYTRRVRRHARRAA